MLNDNCILIDLICIFLFFVHIKHFHADLSSSPRLVRLQTRWNRVVVGYWCIARQVSPARQPSVWPTSCTRSASSWTRPLTSWSSDVKSSPPTSPSWDSCCSSRLTCSVRDEDPGPIKRKLIRTTVLFFIIFFIFIKSPALVGAVLDSLGALSGLTNRTNVCAIESSKSHQSRCVAGNTYLVSLL